MMSNKVARFALATQIINGCGIGSKETILGNKMLLMITTATVLINAPMVCIMRIRQLFQIPKD